MISRAGEVAAIALCTVALAAVAVTQFAPVPPTGDPVFEGDIPETDGPVAYFINNCARCHRSPDDAYTEYPNPRHGDALRAMIKQMATTVAMSPADDQTLQDQYDLHLAIVDKTPYIWIDPTPTGTLAGEIIPGTEVQLQTRTGTIKAKIEEYRFALPDEPGKIAIERAGRRVTIDRSQGE
jgi:hypothetical protein